MNPPALTESFEEILHAQLPNFYRLYLNPYVAQTCFCLGEYVRTTWDEPNGHQTFLANSCHEALSGAIKLARYNLSLAKRTTQGLIFDPKDELGPFVSTPVHGGHVEFLPEIVVTNSLEDREKIERSFGFIAVLNPCDLTAVHSWLKRHDVVLLTCVSRSCLNQLRQTTYKSGPKPDIVVFDESFVGSQIPFGAFTARKELYKPGVSIDVQQKNRDFNLILSLPLSSS